MKKEKKNAKPSEPQNQKQKEPKQTKQNKEDPFDFSQPSKYNKTFSYNEYINNSKCSKISLF